MSDTIATMIAELDAKNTKERKKQDAKLNALTKHLKVKLVRKKDEYVVKEKS